MSYVFAAALGALFVMFVQFALHRWRFAPWRPRHDPGLSFRHYHGLIVPDERGTTEIDEVLVTPAGVFVVEKKDFSAWIYGNEADKNWTAVYPRETHRFQNPLRQNYRHIKALESFLRIERSIFSSVIAFSPRSRLMTPLPPQVLSSDHVAFVRARTDVALSPEDFDRICASLDTLKASSDTASLDRHVKHLKERFDSTTRCPRCTGNLVRRQSRKPGNRQNVFLGCSNFPACRYVRNLEAT